MRPFRIVSLCLLLGSSAHCTRPPAPAAPAAKAGRAPQADQTSAALYEMRGAGEGLHFLYFGAAGGKSTVVEADDHLFLIEVPVSNEGGSAKHLREHREGGERVLRTLRSRFPGKPLRYLLTTHWHPHSASSLAPFVEQGVQIVTTRANFERTKAMLDPDALARAERSVRFVDGDSLELGRGPDRFVALRFQKAKYASTPTEDYLFFYLPKFGALHVGCMYDKWSGPPVAGRELLTSRELDLHALLRDRGLSPRHLIRIDREGGGELLPAEGLERVVREGVRAQDLAARYRGLDAAALRDRRAELVREAVAEGMPGRIINQVTYDALRKRDLERARELATLQAMVHPTDPKAWDTLGEVHYFLGEREVAKVYERAAKRVDPHFDRGGEEVWRANLDEHRRAWAAAPPDGPH